MRPAQKKGDIYKKEEGGKYRSFENSILGRCKLRLELRPIKKMMIVLKKRKDVDFPHQKKRRAAYVFWLIFSVEKYIVASLSVKTQKVQRLRSLRIITRSLGQRFVAKQRLEANLFLSDETKWGQKLKITRS